MVLKTKYTGQNLVYYHKHTTKVELRRCFFVFALGNVDFFCTSLFHIGFEECWVFAERGISLRTQVLRVS